MEQVVEACEKEHGKGCIAWSKQSTSSRMLKVMVVVDVVVVAVVVNDMVVAVVIVVVVVVVVVGHGARTVHACFYGYNLLSLTE